jgi:hypothetical protein
MEMATAALIASGVSAATSVVGGIASYQQGKAQAAQYEEERENARVAALQDEAQRRRELKTVLAQQQALRAGSGLTLFSGSQRNLERVTTEAAERDIRTSQVNYLNRQSRFGMAAGAARSRGTYGLVGGFGQAAETGFQGYSDFQGAGGSS